LFGFLGYSAWTPVILKYFLLIFNDLLGIFYGFLSSAGIFVFRDLLVIFRDFCFFQPYTLATQGIWGILLGYPSLLSIFY